MYERGSLEVPVVEVLDAFPGGLVAQDGAALTAEEVATDLLTCSFVTFDGQGDVRFVHKSFFEFFLARMIKESLATAGRFFREYLPSEVLYFLGGFAPTERAVANSLWELFRRAPESEAAVRRNALGAFLYTSPNHTARSVRNVDLNDLSYPVLAFDRHTARKVSWDRASFGLLQLKSCDWSSVKFARSTMRQLEAEAGTLSCDWVDSEAGSLTMTSVDPAKLRLQNSRVDEIALDSSTAALELNGSTVHHLQVLASQVQLRLQRGARIDHASIAASHIVLTLGRDDVRHGPNAMVGEIADSVVRLTQNASLPSSVDLQRCFLVTHTDAAVSLARLSADSCVCSPELRTPLRASMLDETVCGVFGLLADDKALRELEQFAGWGVVVPTDGAAARHLAGVEQFRLVGSCVVAHPHWFRQAITLRGPLGSVGTVMASEAFADPAQAAEFLASTVEQLRTALRALR